jgi:hypothetical protein
MSIAVEIAEVAERIVEFGPQAFLVTVGDDGAPHVVSVVVRVDGDRLRMGAGTRTRGNLERAATATLVWAPPSGAPYSLIVDGALDAGASDDDSIAVAVSSAVLHRMAGAPGEGPNCLPVGPA